ncbi:hypothetical protein [Amycolatopsis sp. NPDC021455]|uniref:hypothetical protein n=1 Tax=Amycolatopsis sp. NPDC021455 TaxID=3154901 RepID=UPI0033EB09D1
MIALADAASINDVTTWVNYGVLGLVVVGLLVGAFWTKPSVDKLIQERDRILKEKEVADAQRDAMASVLQEKLLPVVGDFIATTRALLPVLQQLQQLQAMIPILQEIIRANEGTNTTPEKRRREKRRP